MTEATEQHTAAGASAAIAMPPLVTSNRLADHVTLLANVVNALRLAIDGQTDAAEHGHEALAWLADLAGDVTESVHAVVHERSPRWRVLSELTQLHDDAAAVS